MNKRFFLLPGVFALCVLSYVVNDHCVDRSFIDAHLVSGELKVLLDAHRGELKRIIRQCMRYYHPPSYKSVRKFSWLPGYLVKFGAYRVQGAEIVRSFIK